MLKVQMQAGAIRKLLYGVCVGTGDNHSLKFMGYIAIQTHKPYNDLHLYQIFTNVMEIFKDGNTSE